MKTMKIGLSIILRRNEKPRNGTIRDKKMKSKDRKYDARIGRCL